MLLRGEHENNLITCNEHVDRDSNMLCDVCLFKLPLSNYFENQKLEIQNVSGENLATVSGKMPKETSIEINEIGKEEANSLVSQLDNKNIEIKSVENAYDISLIYNETKFQPADYNKDVKVKLSNLTLDKEKAYALLHIKDDGNYEILPAKILSNSELEFTAESFSVYIVITVGTNTVSFSGDNFKVFDTNGDEITNGITIADGTNLSFNIIPNDGYGVTDVTCLLASGDSAITVNGYVKGKTGNFTSVTEDLTVDVTTVLAPVITTHPVSAKATQYSTTTFTVAADNATTYYWEYRENRDTYWKAAGSTSAKLSISSVDYDRSGYEYRCLVGNDNFTLHERIPSDIATLSVCQDEIKVGEIPIIMVQPTMDSGKVKLNSGKASYTVVAMGTNLTFTWQYRENEDDYWKNVTSSSIGSAATTTPSDSTTEKPLKQSKFTTATAIYDMKGYQYRCLVGNDFYQYHDAVKTDIVTLSVAEDEIKEQVKYLKLGITSQPASPKVKIGDDATFTIATSGVNTYNWQYKPSGETFWLQASEIGTGYNTSTLTVDTSSVTVDEDLNVSGDLLDAQFRCVVSNSSVPEYKRNSDIALLSVAQDTYALENVQSKIDLSSENITISIPDEERVYNGTAYIPEVTVKNGETELIKDTDYKVTYFDNINAGTATVTIIATDTSVYTGTGSKTFTISKATPALSATQSTLSVIGKNSTQTEITHEGDGSLSAESLAPDVATASITNNILTINGVSAGTAKITVTLSEGTNHNTTTTTVDVTVTPGNYNVNGIYYTTLADAYAGLKASGDTGTIIVELDNEDASELIVEEGYDVTLDTQGNTITKVTKGITNNGTLTISGDGTIQTKTADVNDLIDILSNYGILNIYNGTIIHNGNTSDHARIIAAKGENSSINIYGGTLIGKITEGVTSEWSVRVIDFSYGEINIKGGTLINEHSEGIVIEGSSNAKNLIINDGKIVSARDAIYIGSSNNIAIEMTGGEIQGGRRAIRYGESTGFVKITGGILSGDLYAVEYTGSSTFTIGNKDASVSTNVPTLIGTTYGVYAPNGFYFYDGILQGKTAAYDGEVLEIETGYALYTETSGDYEVVYLKREITDFTLVENTFTYDGTAKEPTAKVKYGAFTLAKGTDFAITYSNNINVGTTATATVTGIGEYTGTVTKEFTIERKPISIPKGKVLIYNGATQVGVEEGEGYTLSGNTGIDVGNYTAIANVDSNYMWNDNTTTEKEIAWQIIQLPIEIIKHPESVTVTENAEVQFSVEASGDVQDYLWVYKEPLSDFGWKEVPSTIATGVNTDTLIISNALINYQGYVFRCIVGGETGATSNTAYLYIDTTQQKEVVVLKELIAPSNLVANISSDFEVSLTWDNNDDYESVFVQQLGDDLEWKTISKNATSPYVLSGVQGNTKYEYRIYAVDENGIVSDYAYTTLYFAIITKQPETIIVPENSKVEFSVSASGEGLSYTWLYKEPTSDFGWKEVPSEIATDTLTDTLSIENVSTDYQGYAFKCLVEGKSSETSNTAYLYIEDDSLSETVIVENEYNPIITTQPETITVSENAKSEFTVEASGEGLTYTWLYKKSETDFGWQEVPETIATVVNTNTLTIENTLIDYQGYAFRCIVISSDESETSNIAYLYVESKDLIDTVIYEVANFSVDGMYYTTLEKAYNAIVGTSGEIIVEQSNVDYSEFVIEDGKTVILNTNGNILTKTVNEIINNGNLIINGGGTIQTSMSGDNTFNELIINNGTLNVNEAKIISEGEVAIRDNGTLIIGTSAGTVSSTMPEIVGSTYAIDSTNGFEFYDGILKGKQEAYRGEITAIESGCYINEESELINNETYQTISLKIEFGSDSMITEWTIQSGDTTIVLPVSGNIDAFVDWGDGSGVEKITTEFPTHTYAKEGTYEITIKGICPVWGYSSQDAVTSSSPYYTYAQYLTGLVQWGNLGATSYGFANCENLKYVSGDCTENTFNNVTSTSNMFFNCISLEKVDLSQLNTITITNMSNMFSNCTSLASIDLTSLNTENVRTMKSMFSNCDSLTDVDLTGIDIYNLSDMSDMFNDCDSIKVIDLSGINVVNVTNLSNMFDGSENLILVKVGNNLKLIQSVNDVPSFKGYLTTRAASSVDAVRWTPSTTITLPEGVAVYVPDELSKKSYQSAWASYIPEEQVRVYIELDTYETILIPKGSEYVNTGYTALGYTDIETDKLSEVGMQLIITNTVDTMQEGTYTVTYTLKEIEDDTVIYEVTRNVKVYGAPKVELYSNEEAYNGEWTNNIIAKIYLQNTTSTWIQYQISGMTEWTSENANISKQGNVVTVELEYDYIDSQVYFREIAADGEVTSLETAGYTYRLEKEAPTVSNMSYETVDKKIEIQATLQDASGVAEYAIAEQEKELVDIVNWKTLSGDETKVDVKEIVLGSNTYVVWVKDAAGNVGKSGLLKVVKDIIPPTATIEIKDARKENGETYVKTETIVLLIDAEDNITPKDQIKMAVYNEQDYLQLTDKETIQWEDITTKEWPTEAGEGRKRIYVLLKDIAGNINPKVVEFK